MREVIMENNTQTPEVKDNNKKLVIIASVVIVALIAIFVIAGFSLNWFGGSSKKDGDKPTVAAIKVVKTNGSDTATTKTKIKIRKPKFGDSVKKVKKYEKKQKDTKKPSSDASSSDGYTYVTYQYTPKAEFYGVKPADASTGSLLQYVFKDKKLFDVRIQFGKISDSDRTKLLNTLTKKFGKPTYSLKYSDGSTRDTWRTAATKKDAETVLALNYSPNSGVIISYETLKR